MKNQLSSKSSSFRVMVWKEVHQLTPLIVMLVVLSGLLSVIWMVAGAKVQFYVPGIWIPLLMPSLLAAGAGAMLIGNEKETRTLRWTVSLPIQASAVHRAKLAAGLIALAVTWVMAIVLLTMMGYATSESSRRVWSMFGETGNVSIFFWGIHTVFILVTGLYTAWRFENAFTGLIALIPIASTPFFLAQNGSTLFSKATGLYIPQDRVSLIAHLIAIPSIGIVGWLASRAANRFFSPADAPKPPGSWIKLDAWRPPTSGMPSPEPFRFPISTLVWQSIHHHPRMLIGLASIYGAALLLMVLMPNHLNGNFSFWLVGFLALSWLGVFAFVGDGSSLGMRFLADRGISPTRVWVARHLAPLSFVSAGLLIYYAAQCFAAGVEDQQNRVAMSVATLGLGSLCVYGISQWVSLLVRVLGGSAFLAPLLSIVTLVWLASAPFTMGTMFGVVLVCLLIPFFATWWSFGDHMDGPRGRRFWLVQAGLMFAIIVLPIANFAWDVRSFLQWTQAAASPSPKQPVNWIGHR